MPATHFASPEDAAMSGFSSRFCRVVASRVEGNDAVVLLDTNADGERYLYLVTCERQADRWVEGASGNCHGWWRTDHVDESDDFEDLHWSPDVDEDDDPSLGSLTVWDEAPAGADMVRVEFEGEVIEEPVDDGAYLRVWWKVPCPDEHPRATAFRIRGEWVAAPQWP